MFTEAQLERIRQIRGETYAKEGLNLSISNDIRLLLARIDDLDNGECSCAEEIIDWTRDRLAEDLISKRVWLEDALENVRIAELMLREAERALAAVQALKDGGMYEHGDEINGRWDAMRALYASQGMLPVPEPVAPIPELVEAEPEAEEEAANPAPDPAKPEPLAQKAPEPLAERAPEPAAQPTPVLGAEKPPAPLAQPAPAPAPPVVPGEQEDRLYAALQRLAAGEPMIQARLSVLAEESGVPKGSCHAVLQRLQAAGRITIVKPPPKNNVPQPNIYRFGAAAEEAPEPEAPKVEEPEPPTVPPIGAAEKLAEAWGATIKKKPTGAVPQSAPLRDRILGILAKSASTTSGLASMLDVKELAICQILEAMKHEGSVQADEIPEAGRRAQLWREAQQEAAQ